MLEEHIHGGEGMNPPDVVEKWKKLKFPPKAVLSYPKGRAKPELKIHDKYNKKGQLEGHFYWQRKILKEKGQKGFLAFGLWIKVKRRNLEGDRKKEKRQPHTPDALWGITTRTKP